VPVDGVAASSAPRFQLNDDSVLVMDRVDLIGDAVLSVRAEQHGTPNLLSLLLPGFDVVAERYESGPDEGKDYVTGEVADGSGVDLRLGDPNDSKELFDPFGRSARWRIVAPTWVRLSPHRVPTSWR